MHLSSAYHQGTMQLQHMRLIIDEHHPYHLSTVACEENFRSCSSTHVLCRNRSNVMGEVQVVSATASMYGCNSSIAWNPTEYIPVVNNKQTVGLVKKVAESMSAIKHFQELEQPTFMAEDVAFFNGRPHKYTAHMADRDMICCAVLSYCRAQHYTCHSQYSVAILMGLLLHGFT